MKITVGKYDITIFKEKKYGYFEHHEAEIEGGLWFDQNNQLEDYDGVLYLHDEVINGIEELAYKVPKEIKELKKDKA